MTVRGYPFDTTDPAGSVTELEWRRLMQWITPSGVLRGEDNELLVSPRAAGANMSVDVATGCAFLVGHYVRSDAVASVAIGDNLTGNPRIDTIVVGMDFVANSASIYCLPGVVAAAPAPLALTQDITSKWEEALGYVYVAAGENVSITAPELSDCRHFAEPQAQDLEQVARLATTAALAASTITGVDRVANANGALGNIDGVAPAVGDRVLDKDHATGSARGLWRVVDIGSASKPWRMRRSYAADTSAKVRAMLMVRVSEGTANGNTIWLLTTDDPIVLGTTALTFTKAGATTAVFYTTHTWAIAGSVAVPSGDVNFIVPMFVSEGTTEVVVLDKVRAVINGGTSATVKLQVNGSDATGFTGISVTTTAGTTDPSDVGLSDLDKLAPVVTAVSGSPVNMTITVYLKHTVTLS